MNEQPTPPMPEAGGALPPPTGPTPPTHHDHAEPAPQPETQPAPRRGPGRTRQIAAVAAVAAGAAITAGIAVAARDDGATTTEATTTGSGASAADSVLPSLDTGDRETVGDVPDPGAAPTFGDMLAPGVLPDDATAFPGGGPRGGQRGERGQLPAFDQSGGDATTAVPGQRAQGAPDAASQGS